MNIKQVTFGAGGRVIKYFIAPCGTKLRSQKEVARFLDPSLKPARYTKAKRLELSLDQIPFREDLHPEDWKVTRDVDPSVFAAHSAHHQVRQNEGEQSNLHKLEKYRARNTSTIACKDDPYPPQRNFEAKRILAFSPAEDARSPKESWTYRPRELNSSSKNLNDSQQREGNDDPPGSLDELEDSSLCIENGRGDTPCVDQELLGSETAVSFWKNGSLSDDETQTTSKLQKKQIDEKMMKAGKTEKNVGIEKYRERLSSLVLSKGEVQTNEVARTLRLTHLLEAETSLEEISVNNNKSGLQQKKSKEVGQVEQQTKEEGEAGKKQSVRFKFVNDDHMKDKRILDICQVKEVI